MSWTVMSTPKGKQIVYKTQKNSEPLPLVISLVKLSTEVLRLKIAKPLTQLINNLASKFTIQPINVRLQLKS